VKIAITSDLHLDFWIEPKGTVLKQEKKMHSLIKKLMPVEEADAIIIAGDIGHYNNQNELFFRILTKFFKNVFWVFGNHDLYMVSKSNTKAFNDNSFNRLND